MVTFLTALHIVVCLFLILVVLLQAGKGGGVGIAFGGGGSQTVFGSSGAGNFLTKLTSATAFVFLVTSLGLAHYSSQQDSKRLQTLAERKVDEKKSEDERAAKLKAELDKARLAAQAGKKTGTADSPAPAPVSSQLPAAAPVVPAKGDKADKVGKVKGAKATANARTPGDKAAEKTPAAREKAAAEPGKAAAAGTPGDGEAVPAKPKRKRRAAPAAEGAPAEGAPAAAPPAPAPPAE